MRFHITVMKPDSDSGRFYTQAFHEVVEGLACGLSALGHDVSYRANVYIQGAQNIVLGAQFADPKTPFPDGTILYNLEQVGANAMHMIPESMTLKYLIWDYSPVNIRYWTEHGITAEYVPIGYVPQLSRIQPALYPEYDVLFYGAISPRRKKVLEQLLNTPNLKCWMGMGFGKERDPLIAKSKVILNLHYYEAPQLFEQVRVSYLLANRKCVVCEASEDFPPSLTGAVREASYTDLAEACRELVKDVDQRIAYQNRGFALFSRLRESDILRPVLARLLATAPHCAKSVDAVE